MRIDDEKSFVGAVYYAVTDGNLSVYEVEKVREIIKNPSLITDQEIRNALICMIDWSKNGHYPDRMWFFENNIKYATKLEAMLEMDLPDCHRAIIYAGKVIEHAINDKISSALGDISEMVQAGLVTPTKVAIEASERLKCISREATSNQTISYQLDDFFGLDIPPRTVMMDPWLLEKDIGMIYAQRGLGKTWVSLSVALAVASGQKFLCWSCPGPRRVVYVDGEMPADSLQKRLIQVAFGNGYTRDQVKEFGHNMQMICSDLQLRGMPSLLTAQGRAGLEDKLRPGCLLVLDNVSSLLGSSAENDAEEWERVQSWFLDLRREGISLIMIHHAGKSGDQRGTSKREDVLDWVMKLSKPDEDDFDPMARTRFNLSFTKSRHFTGGDKINLDVRLEDTGKDLVMWTYTDQEDWKTKAVRPLLESGLTLREISEKTGIAKTTIIRIKNKLGFGRSG